MEERIPGLVLLLLLLCGACVPEQSLTEHRRAELEMSTNGICLYGNRVDCCWGWTQESWGQCRPVCELGCEHGECVGPDQCRCQQGYTGKTCNQDVNECGLKPRPCKHRCMNMVGSYKCFCLTGYMMTNDGTCRNTQTCAMANCQYGCAVMKGKVMCQCPSPGLRLGPDRRTCVDIDECGMGVAKCPRFRKCVNTFGSYICKCHKGFELRYINGKYQCADKNSPCHENSDHKKCRCKHGSKGWSYDCKSVITVTVDPARPFITPRPRITIATEAPTTNPPTTKRKLATSAISVTSTTITTSPVSTTTSITTPTTVPTTTSTASPTTVPTTAPTTISTTTLPTTVPTSPTTVPTSPTTISTTTLPTTVPTTTSTASPTTVPTTAPTTISTTTLPTTVPTSPTTVPTTAPTTISTITLPTTVPTTTSPTTVPTKSPTTVPTTTAPTTLASTTPTMLQLATTMPTTVTMTMSTTIARTTMATTTASPTTEQIITTTLNNHIQDLTQRPRGDVHIPRNPEQNVFELDFDDIELGNMADFAGDDPAAGSLSCSFDQGVCSWMTDRDGDLRWETVADPHGGRYLAAPQPVTGRRFRGARLTIPLAPPTAPPWRGSDLCLAFKHRLRGLLVGSLQVFVKKRWGFSPAVWTRTSGQGWKHTQITLWGQGIESVVFKGERRKGQSGEIAIDDVRLHRGVCNSGLTHTHTHTPEL